MEEIRTRSADEVVADAYVELSKYTARTRNYPGLIDGMKMAYRRLIYQSRIYNNKVKAASIIGEMLKIHPHGDESAYSVLVECTCKYNAFPLFDGKGNFGGLGFGPAAMRYPEAVLNEVARLIYLELIDYVDTTEGEVDNTEPAYLPALIPYAFLAGCSGFSVGLPTPDIPPMNVMQLIDYYINRLEGKETEYPSPDYGSIILNCDKIENSDYLMEHGNGQLWFEPYVIQEDYNRLVLIELMPYADLGRRVNKKLEWYIDEGHIDFSDETSEDGYRFVYTINNFNKITIEELRNIITNNLRCSHSYRFLFEYNSKVYSCNFDYVVNHQLDYLRKCSVRKYEDYLAKSKSRSDILLAINKLRSTSDVISKMHEMSVQELKDIIKGWGFSDKTASAVVSKPISYLTRSHDEELDNEYNNQELYQEYINNPDKYLLTLYYKLKDLVKPFYESRVHSVFKNDVGMQDSNRCSLSDDHKMIEFGEDKSEDWSSFIYAISKYGQIQAVSAPKINTSPVELCDFDNGDEFINVVGDKLKYIFLVINGNHFTVIPKDKLKSGINTYVKLWSEDNPVHYAFGWDEDSIHLIDVRGNEWDVNCSDFVKSRISKPQYVSRYELKYYVNKDGEKFEINNGI